MIEFFCGNADRVYKDTDIELLVYYGNIWQERPMEDLFYGDEDKDTLLQKKHIKSWDLLRNSLSLDPSENFLATWIKTIDKLSDDEMKPVLMDMVRHFVEGSKEDYTNEILTQRVANHTSTQKYMKDFTEVFKKMLKKKDGDYSSFANSDEFKELLRKKDVYFSKYDYGGLPWEKDTRTGLTMAVHSWTESEVVLKSFEVTGNRYDGTFQFTFYDNFGLDSKDVEEYGGFPIVGKGFKAWYILQHYDEYHGRYKPFRTVVTVDYDFHGKF